MIKGIDLNDFSRVHLIGIGGCSMSGLAMMFQSRGYHVQGSDARQTPFTETLEENGVTVFYGHNASNIGDSDLIVYSAAIPETNPERVFAASRGIPELERRDALGLLSAGYKRVAAISGCHGKTTITSMLALISENGGFDATVHVGGFIEFLRGGIRLAADDNLFITEACEYVESFLSLSPTLAVVNNIDDDHLNYFKSIDNIVKAFESFVGLLPQDGKLIACTDDFRVRELYEGFKGDKTSYGMSGADYFPANITYNAMGCPSFDIMHRSGDGVPEKLGRAELSVIGEFNIINALAAAVTALALGADFDSIARAFREFKPTRRRFEYYGEKNGVKVFHDYAHHPGEIRAVLNGAVKYPHNRLFVVFQCNSYSRAKTLFTGDLDCFGPADMVLVPDIYPGRETNDGTVHAKDMVAAIERSGVNALYIDGFERIRDYLRDNAAEGDVVVTLGSGDVFEKTRLLLD